MKTRLFSLFLVFMASMGTITANVKVGDLYYRMKNSVSKEAFVTRGDYSGLTEANIPAYLNISGGPYEVTYITDQAFYNCSTLTSVTIPTTIEAIDKTCFNGCPLTEVHYEGDLTKWCSKKWNTERLHHFRRTGGDYSLDEYHFYDLYIHGVKVTDLTIPSMNKLQDDAFKGCRSITSLSISASVIGERSFTHCTGLTSVDFSGVQTIEYAAFSDCENLTFINTGYANIGISAFQRCTGLVSASIGANSVSADGTSIGNYAFLDCSNLTSVKIRNTVHSIPDNTFNGCYNLNTVILDATRILALNGSSKNTIFGEQVTEYIIGDTAYVFGGSFVDKIPENAFAGCRNIKTITICNSVTSIGEAAFSGCTGLTSMTIPNSVTSIGLSAFSGCSSLSSVHISDIAAWCAISFDNSDANPLYNAHNLYLNETLVTDLVIPNGVTSIGNYAFECSSLTSVTIPNSVNSIGSNAFRGCGGLTSVTIPNSVTSIGEWAFGGCTNLTEIDVAADNPNYSSENGVLFNKDKTTLVTYPGGKPGTYTIPNSVTNIGNYAFEYCSSLTSVTIPNSVTSIGSNAFYGCRGLASVTIGDSVTSIGDNAFYKCTALTSVTIPNSVETIGYCAFWGCSALTSLTIPNSVETIGYCAFWGCSALTSITCEAVNPPILGSDVFNGVNKSIPLYVPAESLNAYKSADTWKDFYNIQPIGSQGIEEIVENSSQEGKFIHDGQIFILRGEKVYTIDGRLVR